jgi:uncharacterized protein
MIFEASNAFSSSNALLPNYQELKTKPSKKESNLNSKNEHAIKLELLNKELRQKEEIIQKLKIQLKENKNLIKLLSKKTKENKSDSNPIKKQKPTLKFQNRSPGFDCKKAKKWDEKKVCSNKDLAYLDIKLSKIYWAFVGSLKNKKIKSLIIKKQIEWIKSKNKCKQKEPESTNCLKLIYIQQIAWLENQSNSPIIPLKKQLHKRKSLFEKLPFESLRIKNQYVVLDKKNNLLWTRLNFFQKVGEMPSGANDCIEWVDQMNRERYGGNFNWRIPTHNELGLLNFAYKNVATGEFENFKYWGFKDFKKNKLSEFQFKKNIIEKINSINKKANCRLVSTLHN